MATYLVQITSDPEPRPTIEVSQGEYERLLRLGLVVGGPADPVLPDVFDNEVSQLIEDLNSSTRAALGGIPPGTHTHPSTQISDSGSTGRALLATTTALTARAAIGAASDTDPRLSDARTPTAHVHPSTDLSDATTLGRSLVTAANSGAARTALDAAQASTLAETVQDILAAMIVAGTNVTVSYDDTAGTYTINASGGGGGVTDPEIVRDTIGGALVAGAGITITVNDAGDTITVASVTASTAQPGVVELSDNSETIAGTATDRAVTPASLAALTATAARSGLVELATTAEATTGTDTTRAVTPAGAKAIADTLVPRPAGYLATLNQITEIPITDALEGAGGENLLYNPIFKLWPHGYTTVAIPASGDNFTAGGWIGANHDGAGGSVASTDSLYHPQKGGWQSILPYTAAFQYHYFRQLVPNVIGFSRGIYTLIADVETNGTIACDMYIQARVNVNDADRELVADTSDLTLTGAGRRLVAMAFQVPDLWDNAQTWDDRSMMELAWRAISTASGSRTVIVRGMALVPGRIAKRPGPSIPAHDQIAIESYYETGFAKVGGLDVVSGQKVCPAQFRTRKALPVAASDITLKDLAGTAGVVSTYNGSGTRTDGVAYTALNGDTTTGDSYRNGFNVVINGTTAAGIAFTWTCDNY